MCMKVTYHGSMAENVIRITIAAAAIIARLNRRKIKKKVFLPTLKIQKSAPDWDFNSLYCLFVLLRTIKYA